MLRLTCCLALSISLLAGAEEGRADGPASPEADAEATAPSPGPDAVAVTAAGDAWRLELLFAAQPDQTRSVTCGRGLDCLTPARSFVAGAVRGRFERPGRWWAALTLGLGRAEDHERRPADGYGVMSLRADVQVELGRGPDRLGAALRVSPTLLVGWSGGGGGVRTDLPAFAALLGTDTLWGEVGLPSIPTQVDPRQFFVVIGWRQPLFTVEGGLATFGSLGYRDDQIDKVGGGFGVWLAGRGRVAATSPWEASLQLAITNPVIFTVGISHTWRTIP